jgi:hypothetical protein
VTVVTPERQDHMAASELLRDQLGNFRIDRLAP